MDKSFTKGKDGVMKFRLDNNGKCMLQNKDGLCNIHSNLGERFLCKTCRIYPRLMNVVDNSIERSLSTSCPEVVKKLLLNNKRIEFNQEVKLLEEKDFNISRSINTSSSGYIKYFWEIRICTIDLLQNRELSIEERLIILGLIYKKIDELIKNKDTDKIPRVIEYYKQELIDNNLIKKLSYLNICNKTKVYILNKFIAKVSDNKDYIDLTQQLLDTMEYGNKEKLICNYNLFKEEKYNKFLSEKEYILENYLVNLVFTNAMPYEKSGEVFNKYLELAILYSLVKLYLLGTDEEKITEERVVKVITLLSRVINHNLMYIKSVIEYINSISDSEMNKLAILVTLIK